MTDHNKVKSEIEDRFFVPYMDDLISVIENHDLSPGFSLIWTKHEI